MKTKYLSLLAAMLPLAAVTGAPAVQLKVTPERKYMHPSSRNCIVQIEVAAKPSESRRKTPINLALVLDRSGSMAGAKLEKAKQAACSALDHLGENDVFSLVTYDDEVEVLIPPRKNPDRQELKAMINKITEGGSTNLHGGVEKGAAQLRKYFDEEKVNRIILLSDGIANVGPSSPSDLAKLGKELRGEGLSVTTIGLGEDYNEDLMTSLAEASHANYYYVQDAEKLPGIFSEELGTVKNVVARNVQIQITLPDGVKPREVLGENSIVFSGQSVTIPLTEFFGSQTRRFLIECEATKPTANTIDLAKVELKYEDMADKSQQSQVLTASVEKTDDARQAEASLQSEVASQVAITRNRLAKEEAVKLSDAGRSKDAAAVLRKQADVNTALPAAAKSDLLTKENQELKAKAGELETSGAFSKTSRKSIQYQNYQDKQQKR